MAGDFFRRAKALFGRTEPEEVAVVPRKKANPYHAVAIVPGPRACAPADALRGKVFLSREAPALPLKKCDNPRCECRYEHFEDRRIAQRRVRDRGVSVDGYEGAEKRKSLRRGRRKDDA